MNTPIMSFNDSILDVVTRVNQQTASDCQRDKATRHIDTLGKPDKHKLRWKAVARK